MIYLQTPLKKKLTFGIDLHVKVLCTRTQQAPTFGAMYLQTPLKTKPTLGAIDLHVMVLCTRTQQPPTLCAIDLCVEVRQPADGRVRKTQRARRVQTVLAQIVVQGSVLVVVGDEEELRPRPCALNVRRNEPCMKITTKNNNELVPASEVIIKDHPPKKMAQTLTVTSKRCSIRAHLLSGILSRQGIAK